MSAPVLPQSLERLAERESLQPDFSRGLRCMIAYMVPLFLAMSGKLPHNVIFAAIAGQSISNVDVRGAYTLRFTLLLAMSVIIAGASGLGALTGAPLALALAATLFVALCTGLWRHLSSDYGPSLAVTSSLLFFIALALPKGWAPASHHALFALAGGVWGVVLQVALWPIRPQHPLRAVVAESWVAAADLFDAMSPAGTLDPGGSPARVSARETALRTALDKAYGLLSAAAAARRSVLVAQLETLNQTAARLAMQGGALSSAMEALAAEPDFRTLAPSFLPVLVGLQNLSRSVALAVVSRQPGHLAAVEVRVRRLSNLIGALQSRLLAQSGGNPAWAQVAEILRHVQNQIPAAGAALRATIERADERAAFSLELFDMQTVTLRPLAAALNLSRRVDPALIRYTARIAVLTLIGVAVFKTYNLPHGYWLPFTMVVVLQPDYGATRTRALQRMIGTLGGSILASLLLWLRLSFAPLMAAIAMTSFLFGYFLKRNYGVAVVFITLFVVLLTEANGPATFAFTAERLGSTTAGGVLALLAALVFWPIWERDRFRPIFSRALRSNRAYLEIIAARLVSGGAYDRDVTRAKRAAEGANSAVFSSLQRMSGDPKNRQDMLERAAAIANGNQRLTRALNLLALHLTPGSPLGDPELPAFSARAGAALETIAAGVEHPEERTPAAEAAQAALNDLKLPARGAPEEDAPGPPHRQWVFAHLARAATELGAMLVAVRSPA